MKLSRKRLGCCSICDKELFEISERFPQDHPYSGEPRKCANPYNDALRVTFLITNGSQVDMTICEGCFEDLNSKKLYLWQRNLYSWVVEHSVDHRLILGQAPLSGEQTINQEKWLRDISNHTLLGVLTKQHWVSINNRLSNG